MRSSTDELRRLDLALLFVHTPENRAAMDSQLTALAAMADSLERFDMGSAAARIGGSVRQISVHVPQEYAAAAGGRAAEADSISSRHLIPAIAATERELTVAERVLRDRSSLLVSAATHETAAARSAAALSLALAGSLALIIAIVLWRGISRPVVDLEHGMAAVADGDFGYHLRIAPGRRDEFGRLAQSFQTMAQQLAELDRLKAEFISIASHELKTPINVIFGYLQLMDEGAYGELTPRMRETLHTIDAQARSLARLVHQLLDVSRFEAGGGKLDLRPVPIDGFLAELEETFRVLAMQRGIDYRVERIGTLPREVIWDPDRMSEVLGNLLSNAFKFTERGGTVELIAEAADDHLHLAVRDTGAGIPPAQLQHIFDKFYQAANQEAAAHAGTGLGLAIAKQIVAAHGGRIAVESAVGLGTTFHITLPVLGGSQMREVAAPSDSPSTPTPPTPPDLGVPA
jgi:signal transduction histidine kinase